MTDTIVPALDSQTPEGPENSGKRYWRSLDDLARTPEFVDAMHREFPEGAAEHSGLTDEVSRRKFLGVVAASVALAGMTSCRKPGREILAYTKRPEGLVPGIPQHYASVLARHGYGVGTLVRSHTGRPTKIEGNPGHPGSLGGADSFMQAEILQLYDPARSKHVRQLSDEHGADGHEHAAGDADAADRGAGDHGAGDHGAGDHDEHGGEHAHPHFADVSKALRDRVKEFAKDDGGASVRVMLAPTSSPTVNRRVAALQQMLPDAKVVRWAPVSRDQEVAGGKLAFGRAVDTHFDFAKAEVVAAFDADFLGLDAPTLAWTRSWAAGRKRVVAGNEQAPNRLYVAESCYTVTGSNADNRFPISDGEIADAVFALAAELGVEGDLFGRAISGRGGSKPAWIGELAKDLGANRGKAAVVVGPRQPAAVHAAAHAINRHLGSVAGEGPVNFTATPAGLDVDCAAEFAELCADLRSGAVKTLVVLGCNPVYDAPADLGFADAYEKLSKDGMTVHCGLHVDETAKASTWHVPMTHELEAWGDLLAYDGTAAIQQPLISPLYHDARSVIEMLAEVADEEDIEGWKEVRATWELQLPDLETSWKQALHDGVVAGTGPELLGNPALKTSAVATAIAALPALGAPTTAALEIGFRASPAVFDGRYSNNSWLQENSTPIEKLTWDNALLMTRGTAKELGVYNGDVVELAAGERKVEAAVWIQPGHAKNAATLHLGYGRRMSDECEVAAGCGFDAGPLRTTDAMAFARGVKLTKTGRTYTLASTQDHGVMEGRPLVRETDVAGYKADATFAKKMSPAYKMAALQGQEEKDVLKSLWTERERYQTGYQWGMVIDLNSCTGCGACVTACVAENNIPMVGKEQILHGREMHWNRMDRYFSGSATQDGVPTEDSPQVVHQMVPCMQCENAPCESVCPVGATMHSEEGLNDMAYNRCIGTRYCNNNCPFKVRRFNWFDFHGDVAPSKQLAFNPDVTVRHRGVMEKCTYCTQRINGAKVQAKITGRQLQDGDIVTACQQSCPADAIAFGDINDPNAKVTQLRGNVDRKIDGLESTVKGSPLNYAMLSEYNLKPRTSYLAQVRNPNPELS